jgi:hypothetical protein
MCGAARRHLVLHQALLLPVPGRVALGLPPGQLPLAQQQQQWGVLLVGVSSGHPHPEPVLAPAQPNSSSRGHGLPSSGPESLLSRCQSRAGSSSRCGGQQSRALGVLAPHPQAAQQQQEGQEGV